MASEMSGSWASHEYRRWPNIVEIDGGIENDMFTTLLIDAW